MKATKNKELANLHQLFQRWKISQPVIADMIRMPLGTFKKKLNGNQTAYQFTPEERLAAIKALYLMAHEITAIYKQEERYRVKKITASKHRKLS